MPSASFRCIYCDAEHPVAWRGREHVLMAALGNRRLVLEQTCRGWNNFFSRSFETPLIQRGTIFPELRALFVPGAPPVERKVDGEDVIRVVRAGTVSEERLPVAQLSTAVPLILNDVATGETFHAVATLPNEVATGFTGAAVRTQARVERARPRLEQQIRGHVLAAITQRAVDPVLHDLLRSRNVDRVEIGSRVESGPGEVRETAMQRRELTGSLEAMLKTMAKVAWCYSALRIGPQVRRDAHATRMLRALMDHATTAEAAGAPSSMLETVELDQPVGTVAVWRQPWAEVDEWIRRHAADVPPSLHSAHLRRKRHFRFLARSVGFWVAEATLSEDQDRFRFHRISLLPWVRAGDLIVSQPPLGAGVLVELFGGFIQAEVRVCGDTPPPVSSDVIDLSRAPAR